MEMMALQPRRRRRRSSSMKSKDIAQSNRRIYDPRRWHKRSSSSGIHVSGQPPAGWVLIWAGRFKRWRRRWFVAHPPGLLLHYKNSDQIGRPGCISLLGATIVPATSKERQFKIIKGSIVYYLRTINRDYRQPWLDTIQESLHTYNKSLQKAGVGAVPLGCHLLPQESVPSHVRGDWEEQDKELNRRIAGRLQDVEPARREFLQQLQALQQSISTISGVLGFANSSGVPMTGTVSSTLPSLPEVTWRSNGMFVADNVSQHPVIPSDDKLSSPDLGSSDPDVRARHMLSPLPSSSQENGVHQRPISRSLFKWKSDSEYQNSKVSSGISIRSHKSTLAVDVTGEKKFKRERRRSLSLSLDDPNDEFLRDGSCIGAECFPGRKMTVRGSGHLSDTELGSKKWKGDGGSDFSCMTTTTSTRATSCQEPETNSIKKNLESDNNVSIHPKQEAIPSNGSMSKLSQAANLRRKEVKLLDGESSTGRGGGFLAKGPLHAAWNRMQETFTDALKEEIQRVLELEAENAVLQESLATLPQLRKDRMAFLKLQEHFQKECVCGVKKNLSDREDGEEGDDEGDDTEEEISIVPTEVTNEEYFEALEVLNQHEYLARVTTLESQESLAERVDGVPDSPEEGDYTGDTDILSEAEGEDFEQPRTRLPAPRPLSRGFSVWTVLKNAVGRDLSHITMPATINEPLSVLQKCAEELQFRELLEQAVQKENSLERLLYATAFACASYHGSIHRDAKPFNPLLGETYEFQDGSSWFLAEQVSHHPPIFAFHTESNSATYKCYGEIEIKNKFWGRSIEVLCNGVVHLKIPKFGDHITWNRATLCIHNVVVGKLWIDNYGEVLVRNHSTGEMARVRFHKATSQQQCHISGKIYDAIGAPQYTLFGNYMDRIYACPEACTNFDVNGPDVRLLWKAPEMIEDYHQQYCFTAFTLGLNDLTPKLAEVLPPTDSRFRPDQRALENGDLEKATPEKLRLEEKQRLARRTRKEQGLEWQDMWFGQREPGVTEVKTVDNGDMEPSWVYKGTYWEARERQAWENCPDIM